MVEPQKPFACNLPDCGMTFTNEDHLHVHTKKHDMQLQFGPEQKAAFVADQTPTPTRFIRNCEEVGLFQDLQNVTVNPFDEGFKRAMEAKPGILSLENTPASDDVLHTPQMVFPLIEADSALFTASCNQRNITISRSSSDESTHIREYATLSKLTNAVTTVSRIVGSREIIDKLNVNDVTIVKSDLSKKDNTETVSYKNNVVQIHSNVEIRKGADDKTPVLVYTDSVKDVVTKDVLLTDINTLRVPDKVAPPIMSQKSLDYVVDALTSELNETPVVRDNDLNVLKNNSGVSGRKTQLNKKSVTNHNNRSNVSMKYVRVNPVKRSRPDISEKPRVEERPTQDDYEVIIKLPDGKRLVMKPTSEATNPKDIIRNNITRKLNQQSEIKAPVVNDVIHIPGGTLIPVTIVNNVNRVATNNLFKNLPVVQLQQYPPKIPISANSTNSENILSKNKILNRLLDPLMPASSSNFAKTLNISIVNEKEVPTLTAIATQSTGLQSGNVLKTNSAPHETDSVTGKGRKRGVDTKNPNESTTEQNANEAYERTHEESVEVTEEIDRNEDSDCLMERVTDNPEVAKRTKVDLMSRCAASKRYRTRIKHAMKAQSEEINRLRESNQRLVAEKAALKLLITQHMARCPHADDLRKTHERIHTNSKR